jgi:beta-glucanase (GH16 family)
VLVWADEFNGAVNSAPDPTKWNYELGANIRNHELQTYTDDPANAHIVSAPGATDGKALAITALRDTQGHYTSASLETQNLSTWTYGRMEMRAKLPYGKGMWPAFWMLGSNIDTVGWPACGEVDIMETIGTLTTMNFGTIHGPGYQNLGASYTLPGGQRFQDAFHTFALDWAPNRIQFSVDGNVYETRTPADLPAGRPWVFNHDFYLKLNLAVGGTWPGSPDGSTVFPQTLLVDYVRIYEDLPDGWGAADIGGPGRAGSSTWDGTALTVRGSGADIWGTRDQFQFASQQASGDTTALARITSISSTDPWAKAGLMFRDGLAANARFVDLLATPGNGVAFEWRDSTGGTAHDVHDSSVPAPTPAAPLWLMLVRSGDNFTGFYSTDNVTWTQVGDTQTIPLPGTTQLGLAVTSHNDTLLSTATFDTVQVSPSAAPRNLTATAGDGLVTLSWTASRGAASYNIYRGTAPGGEDSTPIATGVTATAFTDTGLTDGTAYFYLVTAVSAGQESMPSSEGTATPLATAGFGIHINFTNNMNEVPSGYINDIGLLYGERGNGFRFGWNRDNRANARDRDDPTAPDERYDSFTHMQKPGNPNAWWRIALPNGVYAVHVVAGDASAFDSVFAINVQAVPAVRGTLTSSNRFVEGTVTVSVSNGLLTVSNASGAVNNKIAFLDITQVSMAGIDFSGGFAGAAGLALNDGAAVSGTRLRLTDGQTWESRGAFWVAPVDVQTFTTDFRFQLTNPSADGFTFTIQGVSPTVVGGAGGGLGYAGIPRSVAIKFDLYDNAGEGPNSTGLYVNGAMPTGAGSVDLLGAGIDLHSGHVFATHISYDGSTLSVTITDETTGVSATQSYAIDIPGIMGGPLGYVGFTAGTGGQTATQDILSWTYMV